MRVSLSRNESLVYNKFLRKFKQSLEKFGVGELMCIEKVYNVLGYLGYIDEYTSEHTQQLSHSIAYLLSENRDCLVSRGSLFQFLRLISDMKKISKSEFSTQTRTLANDLNKNMNEPLIALRLGYFSQQGQWKYSAQQEAQVKKIFRSMNLKRISRQKIEAQQKDTSQFLEQQTFKPQISEKSKILAKQRYKKVSLSKSKVEDRLIMNQSLQKSRLEAEVGKSVEKEMKQCYFKPKINSNSREIVNSSLCKYIDSMNTSFENKQNEKSLSNVGSHQVSYQSIQKSKASRIGDKLLSNGREYEQNLERIKDEYKQLNEFIQMKECTFQPKLYQKAYNHSKPLSSIISAGSQSSSVNTSKIRNVDKSIQRMKEARRKREFQNQVKERGYPQNVAWTKLMNSHKSEANTTQKKTPILCIDLKIMESTRNIQVYEGQAVQEISEQICVQNSVPHEFWCRVENLLKCSIQQCDEVRVHNNKIYLNR